jgi:hypothetical protein
MLIFTGIADAADAARRYFLINQAKFPDEAASLIEPHTLTGSSPVDLVVNFTEGVYANRGTLPAEAMEVAAGLASIIDQNGFHGRLDGRAPAIALALRREAGEDAPEGQAWPDEEADPAPRTEFAPKPEA